MKVAYQGEPGAYSERAVRSLFPDAEPMPCETVRLVFSRVTSGEAEFGVVPLENSQAGSVNETYDLLQHTSLLRIVGEAARPGRPRAARACPAPGWRTIRRAHSHWQALAQCEEFLVVDADRAGAGARHGRRRAHDRRVGERTRTPRSRAWRRARGSGLAVLAERIQTEKENFTKFAAIGIGRPGDLGAADKTSLVMAVLDEPGSLLASLQPFAARGINLHKLESRPRRGKPFEYVFYVDLMAAADDPRRARRRSRRSPSTPRCCACSARTASAADPV